MTDFAMTAGQLAELLGGEVAGDPTQSIKNLTTIDAAQEGDATFALDARRASQLARCAASVVLVPSEVGPVEGKVSILVDDPAAAISSVLTVLSGEPQQPELGVHPAACVDPSATLGKNVRIGANATISAEAVIGDGAVICENVFVGKAARIGDESLLMPGSVVGEKCVIGKRCRLNPNSVVGSDGFGYITREGVHHRIPHAGNVVIGDDVDLGACACIDRGKFGPTVIGNGCKLDNQIQIGHGAQLGNGVIMAGQSGIAGSAKLGNYVVMGGNSGVRDNITIGDGVQIAAYSAAAQSLEPGQTVGSGIPAMPTSKYMRMIRVLPEVPDMKRQIKKLTARIEELEKGSSSKD